jgi:hypothetical protein
MSGERWQVLTEYPRTLAPLGTHMHCARAGCRRTKSRRRRGRRRRQPQRVCATKGSGAAHCGPSDRIGRRDCSRGRRCCSAVGRSGTGPYRSAGSGESDGLANARGGLCASEQYSSTGYRPPALGAKASGLRSMASPRCRRTGRLCIFYCLRPRPLRPSEQPAQAAGASGGSRRPRHCQRKAGAARIRVPDLPGQCRGPPGAVARALSKARRPGTRRTAQTARGACPGRRRPRAIPRADMAADRVFNSGRVPLGPGTNPGTGGLRASAAKRSSHNGDWRILRLGLQSGSALRAPSCQAAAPGGQGELRRNHSGKLAARRVVDDVARQPHGELAVPIAPRHRPARHGVLDDS